MIKNVIVYAIEAICLGIFMVVATLATTAFELPTSPLHQAITDPLFRRLLIGIAMGLTAISIIYSPWGKEIGRTSQSSGDINLLAAQENSDY